MKKTRTSIDIVLQVAPSFDRGSRCGVFAKGTTMSTLLKTVLAGNMALLASLSMACGGAVCGDGITEEAELCDDSNTADGDGCSAVCAFEAPKTDYRLVELGLVDELGLGRFNTANLLLQNAIDNGDIAKALNIIIQFASTTDAATTALFGPAGFDADVFSFLPGLEATADVSIEGDTVAFVQAVPVLNIPIEEEVGSGVFSVLALSNVDMSGTFAKKQAPNGGLFTDQLKDAELTAVVDIFSICELQIDLDSDPDIDNFVSLVDVFDDGDAGNGSSIVPDAGETADDNNCVPCGGPNADPAICTLPDTDLNGIPAYNVKAFFKAEGGITIQ
jgi:cysteine-rich repeat protein